jgi:hypothetical protein
VARIILVPQGPGACTPVRRVPRHTRRHPVRHRTGGAAVAARVAVAAACDD